MNSYCLRTSKLLLAEYTAITYRTPTFTPSASLLRNLPTRPIITIQALRFTSSQSSALVTPTSGVSTTTATTTTTVNAPLTTIPVALQLPTKSASTSQFSYLFKSGKAYLTFFKTGLKAIYTNYTGTRALQALVNSHGGTLTALVYHSPPLITRSEFQYLLRARHDILRVPAFALIFLVFGETSPFILPFIPSIVPYPCRIPAQLTRQRRKAAERRGKAYAVLGGNVDAAAARKEVLTGREVAHVARVLGVDSWFVPLEGLRRWRVNRRVEYLALDDELLRCGGGVRALDAGEEVMMAAQERGIDTYGREEKDVRDTLDAWVRATEAVGGVKAGIWLLRPENWNSVVVEK